jgi:limonene 1,2-monooxygenase
MPRLQFGTFLAPHHPLGESPTTQFQRDLDFAEHLDRWGFDEFWCGEHHSSGWEMIASPEMFLAAAGQRTHRIRLGTGVVSLPYHHPLILADRIVMLSEGRVVADNSPAAALDPELLSKVYGLPITVVCDSATGSIDVRPVRSGRKTSRLDRG